MGNVGVLLSSFPTPPCFALGTENSNSTQPCHSKQFPNHLLSNKTTRLDKPQARQQIWYCTWIHHKYEQPAIANLSSFFTGKNTYIYGLRHRDWKCERFFPSLDTEKLLGRWDRIWSAQLEHNSHPPTQPVLKKAVSRGERWVRLKGPERLHWSFQSRDNI